MARFGREGARRLLSPDGGDDVDRGPLSTVFTAVREVRDHALRDEGQQTARSLLHDEQAPGPRSGPDPRHRHPA
ncbi:hypothetical protein SVIOM74S_07574 [Streptomyces violarus]